MTQYCRRSALTPSLAWIILALSVSAQALEIGPSDFQITQQGPALDSNFRASNPGVAYNTQSNEFLVVWSGSQHPIEPVFETEIYAQRLDGDSGALLGQPIRVSQMGPDGPPAFGNKGDGGQPPFLEALDPVIAWNGQQNEFLVVWWGDDTTPPLVDDKREVFGRRLGLDGNPVGDQFRISFMGAQGDTLAEGISPEVIYNPTQGEYFVTWQGDNINGVFADQEFEIWGQRITGGSNALAGGVIRISDMGEVDGDNSFTAADSDITLAGGNYLVVWEGDDDGGTAVDGEQEIYGQLIDASTGTEVGDNDFRISFRGPVGATDYDSGNAVVAFNPQSNQFLVAYNGSDDDDGTVRNDIEVYVQGVTLGGSLIGEGQRISSMGPDGVDTYWGLGPQIAYDSLAGEFLIVWIGENDTGALINNEFEVYGKPLTATGNAVRPRRRLSQMRPDGLSYAGAGLPRLARNPTTNQFLMVFSGNDSRDGLAPREREIFGQFLFLDIVSSTSFE
ncbi:MAG: hypothetical protein AB8B96_00875 [Lysobacterales bacterium]